jgi:Na+/phosphate symporter
MGKLLRLDNKWLETYDKLQEVIRGEDVEEIERLNKELDKIEAAITRYIKQMDREELEQ